MHPLRELTLRELTLPELRRRTSIKWREYDADVDAGYPHGSGYAEEHADFAADRWGWEGVDSTRTALVADVMTGIVEVFALVSEPGDPVVVNPPVYPPFFGFIDHSHRVVVEAPLGEDGRLDLDALEAPFIHAGAEGRPVTYLLCNPQNPTAVFHTAAELAGVCARIAQTILAMTAAIWHNDTLRLNIRRSLTVYDH